MKLSVWLQDRGAGIALARDLKLAPSLVSQWGSRARPIPIERCYQIELATAGAVTRRDLRPDDWQRIWPELATPPCAAPVAPVALASPAKAAPA